ncbi:MAG: GntR family transcriptional regulator [Pirellulales bacterium]
MTTKVITPTTVSLADRLVADIRAKGLRPGDPYLSMRDTARMLGVSNNTVGAALKLLVKRGVLHRRQRLGTFVAEGIVESRRNTAAICRVHLLVHRNYLKTEGMNADETVLGLQGRLPGANVQISLLSPNDEARHVQQLVDEAFRSHEVDGFVLVRAPLAVQRIIAASGMPAVVYGSLYPSVESLPHVSRDMRQIGLCLTEYLLARGYRRIFYLVRQQVLPGDMETLDAIVETMARAGLGLDAFTFRAVPVDVDAVRAEVRRLLARHEPPVPTGVICRGVTIADGAAQAAVEFEGKVGIDVGVTVCDYYLKKGEQPRYAYPRPMLDAQGRGDLIGQILAAQANGVPYEHLIQDTPVELTLPGGGDLAA